MSNALSLKPSYYEALKRLTLELAGINLGKDHRFLIETRLTVLARQEGFTSLTHLIDELFSQGQARLALQVVSCLLERDTHFNADPQSLNIIGDALLPALNGTHPDQPLRILSFGCSSGQEPYSVAIQVDKLREQYPGRTFDIYGIDYPSPALERAKRGVYTHFEVQRGLPIRDLISYFERRSEDWVVKAPLREMVTFEEQHLLSNLSALGSFHIVLFRNAMPYYSSVARVRVLRSLSSLVAAQGYLVLGSKDRMPRVNFGLQPVAQLEGIFRKRPADISSLEMTDSAASEVIQTERLTLLETELSRIKANEQA